MGLSYERLDASSLEAWMQFARETWPDRPSDDAFARWRYLEAPNVEVHLLRRDGEVVAAIGLRRRQWCVGGKRVDGGETMDWFARPDVAQLGFGIRVIRRLMAEVAPIVAAGGTEDTRTLLPRLGWQRVGELQRAVLPLRGAAVVDRVTRRVPVPAGLVAGAFDATARGWFTPWRAGAPRGGEVVPVAGPGPEVRSLYDVASFDLCALPDVEEARWLRGHPSMGAQLALYFVVDGELRGWTRLRVSAWRDRPEGVLQDAWTSDPSLWTWMVRASARALDGLGATVVQADASHPAFVAALKACHFLFTAPLPIWFWGGRGGASVGPLQHVTRDLEDHGWLPYPVRSVG